jgi:hypothetical protein
VPVKVGQRLALHDGTLEHQVHALAGALNEAAFAEGLGEAAVSRLLLIEDVLGGDAGGQTARADDFKAAGELANENGSGSTVIAVASGVEDRFAHWPFVEGGKFEAEEAVLVALAVVALVDEIPERVVETQQPFAKLVPFLRGTGRLARTILEDEFGLGEVAGECGPRAHEDQCSKGGPSVPQQVGIGEDLFDGRCEKTLVR